jgi:predicted phosphate transport protein (TIGR00153 family)
MKLPIALFPREGRFFALLKEAAENVAKSTLVLQEAACDPARSPELSTELNRMEHEGDRITREIIGLLNVSLVTPIDREDITALAQNIDHVVDVTEGLIERLVLYKITETTMHFKLLAQHLCCASAELALAVGLLNKPKKYDELSHHCDQVIYYEKRADRVYREAIAELFENGKDFIHVIKWREIYGIIEDAVDATENVCDILQGVVVKGS